MDNQPPPHNGRAPLQDITTRNGTTSPQSSRKRIQSAKTSNLIKKSSKIPIVIDSSSALVSAPETKNKRVAEIFDAESGSKRNSTALTASGTSIKSPRSRGRKTHVGPWQLGRTLGKGSIGRVRLTKPAVTGQVAAIKIMSKRYAAMAQSTSITIMDLNNDSVGPHDIRAVPSGVEREIVIMKLIEHPNIINLYDVWENRGEL